MFPVIRYLSALLGLALCISASRSHASPDITSTSAGPMTAMEDVTPDEIRAALTLLKRLADELRTGRAKSQRFAQHIERVFSPRWTHRFAPTYASAFEPLLAEHSPRATWITLHGASFSMDRLVKMHERHGYDLAGLLRGFGTELVAGRCLAAAGWHVAGLNFRVARTTWDLTFASGEKKPWLLGEVKSIAGGSNRAEQDMHLDRTLDKVEEQLVAGARRTSKRPTLALFVGADRPILSAPRTNRLPARLARMEDAVTNAGAAGLLVFGINYLARGERLHNGDRFTMNLLHPGQRRSGPPTSSMVRKARARARKRARAGTGN